MTAPSLPDLGLSQQARVLRDRLGAIMYRLDRGSHGHGWDIYQTTHLDTTGLIFASVASLSEVRAITEAVEGEILARVDDAAR